MAREPANGVGCVIALVIAGCFLAVQLFGRPAIEDDGFGCEPNPPVNTC